MKRHGYITKEEADAAKKISVATLIQEKKKKIEKMSKILIDTLSKTDNVKLYSNNTKSGVILFNIADLDCGLVADILSNKYHVCARSGLHCAPLAHKNIGTEKTGAVRLSLSGLNHIYEAYYVARAIENIASDRSKYQ